MIDPNHGPSSGLQPSVSERGQHGLRVTKVVEHLHGHEQVKPSFGRPLGKHAVVVVTCRVGALGFLDHRRCSVHPFGMRAKGHRGELPDHPSVAAPHVDGAETTAKFGGASEAEGKHFPDGSRMATFHSLVLACRGPVAEHVHRGSYVRHAVGFGLHRIILMVQNTITPPTGCTVMADLDDVLHPRIEPHLEGMLEVSDLHSVAWEVSGHPEGTAVLVIHGGPGGGSQPDYRRYFDPNHWRIVQFDQRGCGRSTPWAELEDNTTMASVTDIERLRNHLGIDQWVVFGGSWGSSLSLIYAQHHPDRVQHLVLRGIFLCRESEFAWFYQEGASHIFPDAFEGYRNHIPEAERGDLMRAYHARLTSEDEAVRHAAAREWTRWEMATSYLIPKASAELKADDLQFAVAFARIECHYFTNGIFMPDNFILDHVDRLSGIPIDIVQGRYDVVCPTRSAWDLHTAAPHSRLHIIGDAGHSMTEPPIAAKLVAIMNGLQEG